MIERRRPAASALSCALLLLAGPLSAPGPLPAQDPDTLPEPRSLGLLDPSLSPYAATVTLGAAADAVYAVQDRYVPLRVGDEDGILEKAGGIGYRLVRLTLVDGALVGLHSVVRHEVAGHGGRIRQLGGDVRGYEIDLPPPYGGGGGATSYRLEDAGPEEGAVVAAGGLESAVLDARRLEERWVDRGRMDSREALRYLYDLLEVRSYIEDARSRGIRQGHDVENYVGLVNASAPANAPGEPITVDALREASSVELLNPGFYYALYAVFGRYLVAGERRAPVPAPGIGAVRVMPTLHLRLAPFGREYSLGLIAAWEERVLRAGVRMGDGPRGTFGGLELAGRRLYTGPRFRAGARVGLWRQFDIGTGSPDPEVGGLAVVRGTATVPSLPVSPVVELGAKTRGYAPGEALSAGPIVRLGASLSF